MGLTCASYFNKGIFSTFDLLASAYSFYFFQKKKRRDRDRDREIWKFSSIVTLQVYILLLFVPFHSYMYKSRMLPDADIFLCVYVKLYNLSL